MLKHIAAIGFIFCCTAVAWLVLGATIFQRTYSSDSGLRDKVMSTWGSPQTQNPPSAAYEEKRPRSVETIEAGRKTIREEEEIVRHPLQLEKSRIRAAFDLGHRQKGLLWYSTYAVDFAGAYTFRNPEPRDRTVIFTFSFPARETIYDDLTVKLNGVPITATSGDSGLRAQSVVPAGGTALFEVSYRSRGLDSWNYSFGSSVSQIRDFDMRARTNFRRVDFPTNTLSPTSKREIPGGWDLAWTYRNLVSGYQIGVTMPAKLQPGPLAGRISLFAPVSLFFFFFLMFIITTLRGIHLHPMNYFFLAAAFFAFHLLLAYLVDHVSIHVAFVICSLVSVFLVVSYLRLVLGLRFAAVEAGLSQLVYLVLFSYAFFFEGYTGLTVTIGSILTLFVVMQLTGRIRWDEKFARGPSASTVPTGAAASR